MPFDFASVKAKNRRAVHDALGVDAFYSDASVTVPVPIKARWHSKIDRFGDPNNVGFTEIIQGIDRIVLFPDDTPEITFVRGGLVEFPGYGNAFKLDSLEPRDGPLSRTWIVAAA